MVPVVEEVVSTWEAALQDVATTDVTIRVLPGGADSGEDTQGSPAEVRAHSAVLQGASSVLKAMLSQQGMREGANGVIEVNGCSAAAVRLLLSLVYTGAPCNGPSGEEEDFTSSTILAALDLAHRWQLLHVVQLLSAAASRRVDADTFEAAADAALRLELPFLLAACRAYAAAHAREMRQRLTRGGAGMLQSAAVRADVEKLLACEAGSSAEAPTPASSKRRRRQAL